MCIVEPHLSRHRGTAGVGDSTPLSAGVAMGTVKIQVPGPVSVVVPATACELAEGQNIGIVERERVRGIRE